MDVFKLALKIRARAWNEIVKLTSNIAFYPALYRSYWHMRINNSEKHIVDNHTNFYTGIPNPGAGIGHQLSNWISGYWWAMQFNLKYAHTTFSTEKWETFFGFGENETLASDLISHNGYRRVLLPLFDENKQAAINLNKKIISSYAGQKVVFVAEQDQSYQSLCGVIEDLRLKFFSAAARKCETLIFSESHFNIAIQIRRGDITIGQTNQDPNLQMRWQDNLYFKKLLTEVIENIKPGKPLAIYLFSQGTPSDFIEFIDLENINFCLDMDAQQSFLHMVFADLLITSKSSFSYKPALLNKGIKVCPRNFWHNYPNSNDWVLVDDDGNFDVKQLSITL
ncbi:MAG: hypothetical protein WKF66_19220 [Pedobacter sp.]